MKLGPMNVRSPITSIEFKLKSVIKEMKKRERNGEKIPNVSGVLEYIIINRFD